MRRPNKYNPDKRDFVLTETALNNFNKQGSTSKVLKEQSDFDIQSDISKSES